MQRLILTFLAVISLLLGVSAAIGTQAAPALADTTIPMYGCGGAPYVTDYNGNPIGGGEGYSPTYASTDARHNGVYDPSFVVSTAAQLKAALAHATHGNDVIYVADGATIVLNRDSDMFASGVGFCLRPGTTICGGRGRSGITGGVIRLGDNFHEAESYIFMRLYAGCRLIGLHIDAVDTANGWHMTAVRGSNVEIANCELHGFGQSHCRTYNDGTTSVLNMWVHHNYIHHTLQSDGMAVAVVGGSSSSGIHSSALVEGNYFNNNNQTMGGARGLASFIFRYNYIGPEATGKCIDLHGPNDGDTSKVGNEYQYPAGYKVEVYNNTCLASGSGFVRFKGPPHSAGFHSVHNNWTYETKTTLYSGSGGKWAPICQQMYNLPEYGYNTPRDAATEPWGHHPWVRMEEYDNWWGTTPPPSNYSPSPVNQPPATPAAPSGPVSGQPDTYYTYWVTTTDPDGDMITYTLDWGDGTTSSTGSHMSGTKDDTAHAWKQAGTYAVKVRGTDSEGNVSVWSPSLTVVIAIAVSNQPPATPAAPSGPVSGQPGIYNTYWVTTTDPDGDMIRYEFDWGDGTTSRSGFQMSGAKDDTSHAWKQAGTYAVKVRGTDSEGNVSAWSPSLTVVIAIK